MNEMILFFILWWYATGFSIGGVLLIQFRIIKKKKLNNKTISSSYITRIDIDRLEQLVLGMSWHQILESELSMYSIIDGRKFYCKDTKNFYYDYNNKRYKLDIHKSYDIDKILKGEIDVDCLIEREIKYKQVRRLNDRWINGYVNIIK